MSTQVAIAPTSCQNSPGASATPTMLSANENPACKPLHTPSLVVGAGETEQYQM